MISLVIAEHDNVSLNPVTRNAVSAAAKIGGEIHVLVAGKHCAAVADAAAKMDGVTGWKLFWNVTVPSVRPSLIVVLTTIAMATLKAFDVVRTMTGGQFDTSIVANEFYTQTFGRQAQGIGAALAVLLFILVMPLIVYNVRQMRISEGER